MPPSEGCAVCASLTDPARQPPIFEDELWHLRHDDAPSALPGWLMLIARRHVGGPAHFDDREAHAFGPTLRHFSSLLEQETGALRIYTAALGESSPHFHAHLVPRYAEMPRDAKAWAAFDLQRAARAGEIPAADPEAVARLCANLRRRLTDWRRSGTPA
ncbi:MAG TPA: HIT domain-containing protein [Polyangia bacterium]|nr:HIT domain-containing protein [Polyangia bacterium]HVZ87401.1 HIT domain-containing protein [Polyangia bacterium]